jgi:hypothetical protein
LPAFRTEINTFGAYVDSAGAAIDADVAAADASEANAAASANAADASAQLALSYKDLAAGTANFKGAWSSLSGAISIPAAVYHNGLTWVLLSNLANVAAAEPGISASWVVASGDSYRRFVAGIKTKAIVNFDFSNNNLRVYERHGLEPKQLRRVVPSDRATSATYNSPSGIATALSNVARIEYSPLTGACSGLLVESQRTRLNTASALPVSPQNATVTAAAHTISFYGAGSLTLSGAHTAVVSGIGANKRVTLTFTPSSGTLTMTPSGSVVDLQLELGDFATSIIRGSEGSQVTRNSDNFVVPWASYPEFTILFDVADNGTNDFTVVGGAGDTFDNCVYAAGSSWNVRTAGAVVAILNTGFSSNQRNCVAIRCKAGDYAAYRNGAKTGSSTNATAPAVNMTRFKIGSAPWESTATTANTSNVTVSRVEIYPRALTDSELQALTA